MSRVFTSRRIRRSRRATAVVEFAICLPVLLVLVLGAIECTSMIFLSQSLHVVAYEGVRAAIKSETTAADAQARCQEVIDERGLADCRVDIRPRNLNQADRGTQVTVSVSAPCQGNGILKLRFFSGDLQTQAVMIKE